MENKRTLDENKNNQKKQKTLQQDDANVNELTKHDESIAAALNFTTFEQSDQLEEADSIFASTSSVLNTTVSETSTNCLKNNNQEKPTFKNLKPNLPCHVTRKGKSKCNPCKGKKLTSNKIFTVDGDLLELSTAVTARKRIFELTEDSYRQDVVERIRNTLIERVKKLVEEDVVTLIDIHKIFVNNSIPLSLKLPVRLPLTSLSSLLVIDKSSDFLKSFKESLVIQDMFRRQILEEKNLPVCRCGFIYVHPSLTYAKFHADKNTLIGQLGGMIAFEQRETVMERLDKLRYFLEILYEYLSN